MRIKKLSATGLKIGDFSHDMAALNIITGPNFSGKTARLDAIRLGLLGYLPELGKQPSATAALARNGSMSVEMVMDTGQSVRRSWTTERGSFKAVVQSTLGDVPAVLMDPNEYFSLGEKDRVRYVFGLAKVGSTASGVANVIWANLKGIRVENHGPEHEQAIRALGEVVDKLGCRVLPVQEFVETLTLDFRDRLKLSKQNATRMSQTVQGLTALSAADDEQTARSVEAELASARKTLSDRAGDLRSLNEQIARLESKIHERDNLSRVLARTPDVAEHIAAMELEQSALLTDTEGREQKAHTLVEDRNQAYGALSRIVADVSRVEKTIADRTAKHHADIAHDSCPFCGGREKGWKSKIVSDFSVESKALAQELDLLRVEMAKIQTTAKEINDRYEAAFNHDRSLETAQRRLSQLNREMITFRAGQKGAIALRAKLEAMGAATEAAEIERLTADRTKCGETLIQLQVQIKNLEARQKAYHQAKQDEARNAQALLQRAAIGAEKDVLTEAVKMLEALQAEMVKQAFGPLLERSNAITSGILKTPLEYRDGEPGRFDGATWITHRTFSGTEKAIAYAGISAALAAESPIKIVMIDEMGRLDGENKRRLVRRMVELTDQKLIDQFVGIDAGASDYDGVSELRVIAV